jgi:biotin carboxyl carrier protein
MKLSLTINGRQTSIDVLSPAPLCRFRMGDAPAMDAQVEVPEPGVYSVLLDGRSYDARVEEAPGGTLVVVIDGYRFEIEARDPRRWTPKTGADTAQGAQNLAAPMPGKVVRLLVSAGDAVDAGQGLLVVEAMKMQNEIKAPRAGRVLSLPVRAGATVAAGEVLVTIE